LCFVGVPCLCSFVFCPLFISFLPFLWTLIHVIITSFVPSVFYCRCFEVNDQLWLTTHTGMHRGIKQETQAKYQYNCYLQTDFD
jgi:hypothetical protein